MRLTCFALLARLAVLAAAQNPCALECRRQTCSSLNHSFSCEELSGFGCDCAGCCADALAPFSPPPPPPAPAKPPAPPKPLAPIAARPTNVGAVVLVAALMCVLWSQLIVFHRRHREAMWRPEKPAQSSRDVTDPALRLLSAVRQSVYTNQGRRNSAQIGRAHV